MSALDLYPIKVRRDLVELTQDWRRTQREMDYIADVSALIAEVEYLRNALGIPETHALHYYGQGTPPAASWYGECSCREWGMRNTDRAEIAKMHTIHREAA